MKLFDKKTFGDLFLQAAASPRKRAALDLRTHGEENSQRILNALLPNTNVPIHRHYSEETIIIMTGHATLILYDNTGKTIGRHELSSQRGNFGMNVPRNVWHTIIVHEPSITYEGKDGKYTPNSETCPFQNII